MQVNSRANEAPTPPNADSALLRTVAILTMFVDHAGVVFFPQIPQMRVIGRIAFPLFCWGIVLGSLYTHDWRKYAFRLLMGAIISQYPYMLGLNHQWYELNVMFTLLLGLIAIVSMQKNFYGSAWWGALICLALAAAFRMDYGWKGVLLMILMYLGRKSRSGLAAMFVVFCLYWGSASGDVSGMFGLGSDLFPGSVVWSRLYGVIREFFRLQGMAILALPLMLIHTNSRLRYPAWLHYIVYPGHLLLLYVLKSVF